MLTKSLALLFALALALATADSCSDETCLKKRTPNVDHALLQAKAKLSALQAEKSGAGQCAGAKEEAHVAKQVAAEAEKRRTQRHVSADANRHQEEKAMKKKRSEDAERRQKVVENTRKMSEKARQDRKDAKMKETKFHEAVGQYAKKIGKKRGASIKKTGTMPSKSSAKAAAYAFEQMTEPDPNPEPAPASGTTYCTSMEHFTADLVLHAWCESWEFPTPLELCESLPDCWPYTDWQDQEMCSCQGEEECNAIGGNWVANTCQDELQWTMSPEISEIIEQAIGGESCDDLTVPWGDWPIAGHITWPASQCCDNYPATVCDADAKVMHPCASDEDWMTETYLWGWCDFQMSYPSKELCEWNGCWSWDNGDGNYGCGCGEYEACVALNGTYSGTTCGEDALTWDSGGYGLKIAAEAGTCENVSTSWGSDLAESLKWTAEKCCASYPKTACDPDAKVMTPCAFDEDFLPDATMSGWCSFFNHPTQENCFQEGCYSYENGEDNWECSCGEEQEAACTSLGGTFHKNTCADDAKTWDQGGIGLKEAAEKGTCEEVTTGWGEDLNTALWWRADKCCASYPKSACEPDAKVMTPCAKDEDFTPDAMIHAWCTFNTQPSQSACTGSGCYFYDSGEGWSDCSCSEEAACTDLGGQFNGETCGQEAKHWDNRGQGLKEAEEQGTCEGVTTTWMEDLGDAIKWRAELCCSSTFPATACAKDKVLQHPCSGDSQFEPDAIVSSWCDYHGHEPAYEDCEDLGFCSCHKEDSCNHFNGTWNTQTCKEDLLHWDEGGVGLEAARAGGDCAGVTTSWSEDIATAITHHARKCCTDYPTTICGGGSV